MNTLERLKKEFNELQSAPILSIGGTVCLQEEGNYYKWRATLMGPIDSLYAGGLFYIELLFPNDYPNKGPEIRFLTPIYHLNVNSKDLSSYGCPIGLVKPSFTLWWKPSTTIREILMKLFSIFYLTNPESAWDLEMANEYKYNKALYDLKARYFTKKYANPKIRLIQYKFWDFSCDENYLKSVLPINKPVRNIKNDDNLTTINIRFQDESYKSYDDYTSIECKLNEITKDVIQRYVDKCGFNNYNNLTFVFNRKRLDLNIPILDNGLKYSINIITCINLSYVTFC